MSDSTIRRMELIH